MFRFRLKLENANRPTDSLDDGRPELNVAETFTTGRGHVHGRVGGRRNEREAPLSAGPHEFVYSDRK